MTTETKTYAITEAVLKQIDIILATSGGSIQSLAKISNILTSLPLITGEPAPREKLLGAIGRAWCHQDNTHKVMDEAVAFAVCKEIEALNLYTHPQPLQPKETT